MRVNCSPFHVSLSNPATSGSQGVLRGQAVTGLSLMILLCSVVLALATSYGRASVGAGGNVGARSKPPRSLDSITIPFQEYDALREMFDSLDGPNWIWGFATELPGIPWNFTVQSDPCLDQWQGINCTTSETDGYLHVTELGLHAMGLFGTIPDSVGAFSELQYLSLIVNIIYGTVPATICNLTQLVSLSLGSNLLEGRIPPEVGQLTHLEELGLSTNLLTGPLPDLSGLRELVALDVGTNALTGALPNYLGDLADMQVLDVESNHFTGTLPEGIGQLSGMLRLICYSNLLTGTIPASLGQLSNLTRLALYHNMLTGGIPDTLGRLTQVQLLYLYSNFLSGTIPNSFGGLSSLTTLSLQTNALEGTLPRALCNAALLSALRAFNNELTGTLPACLTLNPLFNVLVMYNNHLSGPLPSVYAANSTMNFLDINVPNAFTGTLPEAMAQLSLFSSFYAGGNLLTGTIPDSYSQLVSLEAFYLDFNIIEGTLPPDMGALAQLQLMEVSGNLITGSLPPSWEGMLSLQELHADANFITGTIPSTYTSFSHVTVLNLFNNLLSGTVPEQVGDMNALQYVGFDSNMLTGSIPASVGNLTQILNFEAYKNRLTGTLPRSMRDLVTIVNLLLENNYLSGNLDGLFNSTTQRALSTVQLSHNRFTGTLPDDLLGLPALQTLAAVTNCFEGSIPRTICNSATVEVIALSGLQSAKVCQQQLLPGLAKSYIIKQPMTGGVPSCLFDIPTLNTLQLSGNGLTGKLPETGRISASLLDLSLSHNSLSGTIPTIFQQRAWKNFDVSYNRFSGALQADLESHSSGAYNVSVQGSALSVENNRLSGRVPNAVQGFANISLLGGNLFGCSLSQEDLPRHDPSTTNYQCGSTTFEVPFYFWLSLVAVLTGAALCAYRSQRSEQSLAAEAGGQHPSALQQLRAWFLLLRTYDGINGAAFPMLNLRYVSALYTSVGKLAAVCGVFAVCALLPLYLLLSTYYGTVETQYAYTAAATFFCGSVALALVMLFLVLLQCLVLVAFMWFWQAARTQVATKQADPSVAQSARAAQSSLLNRVAVYCALLTANSLVVFGMNIAYVYIALYEDSGLLLFAQILLSMFKLGWNKFCGSSLIPLTARFVSPSVSRDLRAASVEFFPLQLFLSLFNNIAIPCLVVMIVSPNCFYYVFSHPPTVTSEYVVNQCLVVSADTEQCSTFFPQQETTTFDPPFTYSYECSASFVTYYAPAFVIMCIMSTFVIPFGQSLFVLLHSRALGAYQRTSRLSWALLLLDAVLPSLVKPPGFELIDLAKSDTDRQSMHDVGRWTTVQRNILSPHFPATQVLLNMLTFLGILLTFGAVFPPLAATLAVTIVGTAVYARLKVGRFLSAAVATKQFRFVELIDQECRGVGTLDALLRSTFMLLSFSCAFYTLFLFDILGDVYGLGGAYWVLIVTPSVPLVLRALFEVYKRTRPASAASTELPLVNSDMRATGETATNVNTTAAGEQTNKANATFNALHDEQL
jgi:Leucine-rich repeat (LRR) protein